MTCGVLGFSTVAYYSWLANPVSDCDLGDAYLTNALLDAHDDDPEFGYRFLADELERNGISVGGAPGLAAVLSARDLVDHGARARADPGSAQGRRSLTTTSSGTSRRPDRT